MVLVGVLVGVRVIVGVGVMVGVFVLVGVGVIVGVFVAVGVKVGTGVMFTLQLLTPVPRPMIVRADCILMSMPFGTITAAKGTIKLKWYVASTTTRLPGTRTAS